MASLFCFKEGIELKRKIYLLLIIMILSIELCIILIDENKPKETKIKVKTIEPAVQIIQEQDEIIDLDIEEEVIEESTEDEEIEETILYNDDIEIETNIENSEVIEDETTDNILVTTTLDESAFIDGHLKEYPAFGEQYGTLIINKIGVYAPIIFGANSDTILNGVGHDSGSYFPGENGSIIMCEHNYMNHFNRLGELESGDIIEIKTDYGDFYYSVYDSQIVLENETEKLPIQQGEENLMIYTCYPFNSVGYTNERYVVYAVNI